MLIIIKTVDSLDFDHHHNFQRSDQLPTDTEQPPMSDLNLFTAYTLAQALADRA
jgi:hypothetical protein